MHMYIYIHICTYLCIYMCVYLHIYISVYMYICTDVISTYIYIYTDILLMILYTYMWERPHGCLCRRSCLVSVGVQVGDCVDVMTWCYLPSCRCRSRLNHTPPPPLCGKGFRLQYLQNNPLMYASLISLVCVALFC